MTRPATNSTRRKAIRRPAHPSRGNRASGTSRLRQWVVDPGSVYQAIRLADPSAQRRLIERTAEIGNIWSELPAPRQCALQTALIERVEIGSDRIDISVRPTRLSALFDVATPLPSVADDETKILSVPVRLRRCGHEIKMLIEGIDPLRQPNPMRG